MLRPGCAGVALRHGRAGVVVLRHDRVGVLLLRHGCVGAVVLRHDCAGVLVLRCDRVGVLHTIRALGVLVRASVCPGLRRPGLLLLFGKVAQVLMEADAALVYAAAHEDVAPVYDAAPPSVVYRGGAGP